MSEKPKCPRCGSTRTSAIYYSCPAQADCADCGHNYEFGEGIKVLSLAEGIAKRPSLFARFLCKKCKKYQLDIPDPDTLDQETKDLLCTCGK